MSVKIYKGINRGVGGQVIMVHSTDPKVEPYLLPHIIRHSPDGFQWGYGGSGPSDTALAILYDCVGKADAEKYYQSFKWAFIDMVGKELQILETAVKAWLSKIKKKEKEKADGVK